MVGALVLPVLCQADDEAPAAQALTKQNGDWYLGTEIIERRAMEDLIQGCEPCIKRRKTAKAITLPGTLLMVAGAGWNLYASSQNDFGQMTQATALVVAGAAVAIPGASMASKKRIAGIYNEHHGVAAE